jgi:diguanylate cyclase (GGDEF)-like protein
VTQPHAALGGRSEVEAVLEESWSGRSRPVRGRELRIELAVTTVFFAAVVALVLAAPDTPAPGPVAAVLVVAYALAARVEFPVGAASFVPTQLFLVPFFAVAPAQLVPALVFLGLLLATVAGAATHRMRLGRVVFCGGDAMHSLGPAAVLVLFAGGDASRAGPELVLLAFAAQLAADLVSSSLHELLVMGVRPGLHVRILVQVWGIDAALTSFGLLAAWAAQAAPLAALMPLPFLGLLGAMAADRSQRVAAAHERLHALEHERKRLRSAVQRVGDAFASSLELDAVLRIVTGAAAEALDAEGARAALVRDGALERRLVIREEPRANAALDVAERALCAADALDAYRERDGRHALARSIGSPDGALATVTVARSRPFSEDERELLAYLCGQAAISAANAARHEALRKGEARLRHQAFHDPLTGLANRDLFADRVDHAVRRHARTDRHAAVAFIDLDGFKLVNDTLGHDAGDELLVAIAGRIQDRLREGDTAGRFGGDEFAVLLEGLQDSADADTVVARIHSALDAPFELRDRELVVTASVGVVVAAPGLSSQDLLRRADLAMYEAKRAGGRHCVAFHTDMMERANWRMELAQDLRGAAGRRELELRFQPIVDLASGRALGAEALVRWRHPRRGLLGPGEFIELAEETGAIKSLGAFVLDEACRTAAEWPQSMIVSVNVSARELVDDGFAEQVHATLRRHDLAAERLILEITESVLVEQHPVTLANLEELRRSGVRLALDDFGTGYSSLSYLAHLPVDILKLDRSFLAHVDESPAHARLVAGVAELGRALEIRLVAEGIERPSQLTRLQEIGVASGQGYLLGAPMEARALAGRLRAAGAPQDVGQPALPAVSSA